MNYANYETAICLRLKVRIIGWPAGVPFRTIASITALDDLKTLNEALVCGDCRWVKMSSKELEELKNKTAGVVKKPRKVRSDSGKPRKRQRKDVSSESEDEGESSAPAPSSRKRGIRSRKAKAMLPPKSKAIVDSEGDDSEEEEEVVEEDA